jgi:cytidine deaminase
MKFEDELLLAARTAADNAYAPYSGFNVGAAIITDEGKIFTGCNVENASYGLTVCAERIALFNAISAGERKFSALAIHTATDIPFFPCGACRQVLAEFNPGLKIIIKWNLGKKSILLNELLPYQFKL